jgi:hypothetical protein
MMRWQKMSSKGSKPIMALDHQPHGVHLVGSIPLQNAEEVFRAASSILGERLHRLPDGETGVRSDWIGWQFAVLARPPQLIAVPPVPGRYAARPRVKLVPHYDPNTLTLGQLGYAEAAIASYATFSRLKLEGALPTQYRFQVSLPTPLAVVNAFVERPDRPIIEPIYEERLLAELDEITAAIPHAQLAIQWDMPIEIGILEGLIPSHLDNPSTDILNRLTRISARIPPDVELGYHLCYGDEGGRHFKQPADTSVMVELANAFSEDIPRPINWLHMPVPRDRTDDTYFAPLRTLTLRPNTKLYLGLIHYTDGVEGSRRRIEAAQRTISDFGLATECGMGRRPPETIPDLLRIHAVVADVDTPEAGDSQ